MTISRPLIEEHQLSAVRTYLLAKNHESVVRDIIEPLRVEAIARWKPVVTDGDGKGKPITTWRGCFRADDQVFEKMNADVKSMTASKHPTVQPTKPDNCPLAEAGELTGQAGRAVILAFQDWGPMKGQGITHHRLLCHGVKMVDDFIELHVKMTISLHPEKFVVAKILNDSRFGN